MKPRIAVLQFAGVNCEVETVRALGRVGLEAETFRWTRPAAELAEFQAYVLPGGFSWQDRVRAGALAAKDPMIESLAARAAAGAPTLGICNGAQVLVECGLVPGAEEEPAAARESTLRAARAGRAGAAEEGGRGPGVEVALARNRMPGRSGYFALWVHVRVEISSCLFTRGLEPGTVLPLPVAHGEGRFTSRRPGRVAELVRAGLAPLRYASAAGRIAEEFPDNPNGSEEGVAALCNPAGNVLAIMPHPERAQDAGALGRQVGGVWGARRAAANDGSAAAGTGEAGPGMLFFEGLARHLKEVG